MFCGNCGHQIEENCRFCSACGTPLSDDMKKRNSCVRNEVRYRDYDRRKYVQNPDRNRREKKKRIFKHKTLLFAIITIIICAGIFFYCNTGFVSNHACDWCGRRPTKVYNLEGGAKSYVCKKCSSECTICGDKATRYGVNYFDMAIFMCDDCYREQM